MEYETGFEQPFGEGTLKGFVRIEVLDPLGQKPPTIIRLDHQWAIHIRWTIDGTAASNVAAMEGHWIVAAYLSGKGNDWERQVGQAEILTAKIGDPPYAYECAIQMPTAQTLGQSEGIYDLTVGVTLHDDKDKPFEIAAFVEGPMIQFYAA